MIKEDIKSYIFKLEGYIKVGSGVLIRSKKGKFYIFTAKHNFKTTDKQELSKLETEEIKECIDNDEINILLPYSNIKIVDVIGLDNANIDFIVLVVDNNGEDLNKIFEKKPLSVFIGNFRECGLGGYPPNEVNKKSIEYFDCNYSSNYEEHERKDDHKYVYELKSNDKLYQSKKTEMDTISGISGGGVFVQDKDDKIYLVGIEIEYTGIQSLIYVSLEEIIDEINRKLRDRFGDEIEVNEKIELKSEENKTTQKIESKIKIDTKERKKSPTIKDLSAGRDIHIHIDNSTSKQEEKSSIEKIIKILLGVVFFLFIVVLGIFFFLDSDKEENSFTVNNSTNTTIAQKGGVVNQTIIYNNKEIDSHKDSSIQTFNIKGHVHCNGLDIDDLEVQLSCNSIQKSRKTDYNGIFIFKDIVGKKGDNCTVKFNSIDYFSEDTDNNNLTLGGSLHEVQLQRKVK